MESQIKPIKRAIKIVGTARRLASMIGVTADTVLKWTAHVEKPTHHDCGAHQAVKIEKATEGKVTRAEICPHLYIN